MKALVLGAGLQGKAVLHDLERSKLIDEIVAGDLDAAAVAAHIAKARLVKTRPLGVDAARPEALRRALQEAAPDVVVCMLPATMGYEVARACLDRGVPFVSTSYPGPIVDLDAEARERGVTILPEVGLDPGIDLVLAGIALRELDEVHGLNSCGGGLPEPSACDNPLNYKITWTFDGVLKAYKRPSRLLQGGREVAVPGTEIFRADRVHTVEIPELGPLEAYLNGDAVKYVDTFGLGPSLREMGRYALRWPGHCAFWYALAQLGFLDDEPLRVGGASLTPHQFLVAHLTPRLQFRPQERDIVILRVDAWGKKNGRDHRVTYDVLDYRDLDTGFFAMNRTVGYTASIAAQMVLAGEIPRAGVLSPIRDVPPQRLLDELRARGIQVLRRP